MQQQVGLPGFFQRGLEAGNQVVRQVANEAHRVAQQHGAPAGQVPPSGAGIQGMEEPVPSFHPGAGQRVHQRAFAGVGVADQRDGAGAVSGSHLAFLTPHDHVQLALQVVDAFFHQAAVFFQLLFARPAHADAVADSGQVGPHPLEPRQGILQLGQLHGQPGFVSAGVGGEDVQDQLGAVQHLAAGQFFQVAFLAGGQVIVEQHHVRPGAFGQLGQVFGFAFAQIGGRIGSLPLLVHAAHHVSPSRFGQPLQLGQRVFQHAILGKLNRNQDGPFRGHGGRALRVFHAAEFS